MSPEDVIIHLGDVQIGAKSEWIMPSLPGRKILVRGNHDRQKSCKWWMEHGFDFACDGMKYRNCWLTHEPDTSRAGGCDLNVHGHLHNIWHGFLPDGQMRKLTLNLSWQRLFAVEYTNYCPIEFDEFVQHPDKKVPRTRTHSAVSPKIGRSIL